MVEQAAQLAVAQPEAQHAVGMWFRPLVAKRLRARQIRTLGELVAFCNARGGSWWRAVPRIGAGRARHLVAWLRRHAPTIGLTVDADVDARDPLEAPAGQLIEVGRAGTLAPLERMAVPHPLSGAAGTPAATNRAALFPYIAAPHDLAAVRAYLYQYRDQPKTLRALYQGARALRALGRDGAPRAAQRRAEGARSRLAANHVDLRAGRAAANHAGDRSILRPTGRSTS